MAIRSKWSHNGFISHPIIKILLNNSNKNKICNVDFLRIKNKTKFFNILIALTCEKDIP